MKIDHKEACRIVVCNNVDIYRDMLFKQFPGLTTPKRFNILKQIAMKGNCGRSIHPRGFAGGIFYVAANSKRDILTRNYNLSNICVITWTAIAKLLNVGEITMRRYAKWVLIQIDKKRYLVKDQ